MTFWHVQKDASSHSTESARGGAKRQRQRRAHRRRGEEGRRRREVYFGWAAGIDPPPPLQGQRTTMAVAPSRAYYWPTFFWNQQPSLYFVKSWTSPKPLPPSPSPNSTFPPFHVNNLFLYITLLFTSSNYTPTLESQSSKVITTRAIRIYERHSRLDQTLSHERLK